MKMKLLSTLIAGGFITAGYSQASVQIIHNCPTPAADPVNIYLYDGSAWGGSPAVSNLGFREATAFVSIPSGVSNLRVAVAPVDATPSITDTLVSFAVPTLTSGESYIAMAAGEIGSSTTPFNIFFSTGQQNSGVSNEFDFTIFHGSTNAPGVSIFVNDAVTPAVTNLTYGSFTGYTTLLSDANHLVLLTLGSNINTMVEGFVAPLQTLGAGGAAGVVFASGYLNPTGSQPAFGLFVALPNGNVIALPQIDLSRIQIVHNSPDPLVGTVDIYIANSSGDVTKIEDVQYKTSTPYLLIPSDDYRAIFCPANSTDTLSAAVKIPFTLDKNKTYAAVAYGLANTSGTLFDHAESVNGGAVAFSLDLYDQAQLQSNTSGTADVLIYHHAPDAPTVDAVSQSTGITILDDLAYADRVGYFTFPAAGSTVLDITPGNNNSIIVGSFQVPLGALNNAAVSVLASGFVTIDDENVTGLEPFGLFAVLPAGGPFIPLANVTSIEENSTLIQTTLYPNPAVDFIHLSIESFNNIPVNVRIMDLQGRIVMNMQDVSLVSGLNTITLNVSALSKGIYQLEIFNHEMCQTKKFIK
ncbi:MAG: DUF4397 domain-containing protein [Flavobacteriales bacterium]|nr:DUF4397 domain-containing protein [Flavobacteriales bacterium]